MSRNPFLFIVLCLVIIGALFFRYLSPSQSRMLAKVADKVETTASTVANNVVDAVASISITKPSENSVQVEEQRLAKLVDDAKQRNESTPKELLERAPIQIEAPVFESQSANTNNDQGGQVVNASSELKAQQEKANQATQRAADLLTQAMKAADEARAQIKLAQEQLANEMRARPNLSLIPSQSGNQAGVNVKQPKLKEIAPGSPLEAVEKVLKDSTVRFHWTKAELDDQAKVKLDNVAAVLKSNPDISLQIVGHTDNNGTDELNNWLGLIRARKVRQSLVARGINQKRLFASSHGAKDPIETNDTPMGRWKNRRVELAIVDK
jgi:outer membrane protein OmpA-like peptidoglycan-associated protein